MLAPYRVLDLSDGRGALCGRALGDLGADVVKVEPPWGDGARRIGPFYKDDPHPENSLFWAFNGANKRSVTLDIEAEASRSLMIKLIESSHFLVESFRPGYLEDLGLGYEAVKQIKLFNNLRVHNPLRPGRPLRKLQGLGPHRHGIERHDVSDGRPGPPAR